MNALELLTILQKYAKEYATIAVESIHRNSHMNDLTKNSEIDKNIVNATIVDFINHIGIKSGVDFGMYTEDLNK